MSNTITAEQAIIECHQLVPSELPYDYQGKGLDLTLTRGELICILGPEKSGKSKWLKSLCALQDIIAGELRINGVDMRAMTAEEWTMTRRKVAYLRHDTALLSAANGLQNVLMPAFYHRLDRVNKTKDDRTLLVEKALDLLEAIDPDLNLDDLPAYIGREQRFKIAVARSLLLEPDVLALNRPFSFFDYDTRRAFQRFLSARIKQGLSVLIITQDLGYAVNNADRIIFATEQDLHYFSCADDFLNSPVQDIQQYLNQDN